MHVSKDFIENVSIIIFLFIWSEYIYSRPVGGANVSNYIR